MKGSNNRQNMKHSFKHFLYILILCPGFSITVIAQNQHSSLLWEISGKDLAKPSYFFGTIHAIPLEKFFLPNMIIEKFNATDQIVLELNLNDPSAMTEAQGLMFMKDTTISNLLTTEDLKIVTRFFADTLGMQLSMVGNIKPLLLSSIIIQFLTGPNPESYEKRFLQMTKSSGKKMIGLETVKEQISCIDQIPLKEQAKLLVETVTEFNKSKKEFQRLVDTYLSQNIDNVYKLIIEDPEFKNFGDALIYNRNQKWVSKIENLIKEQSCFIAVGCGHLGGEKGILALMRKEGYTVKPIILSENQK